MVDDDSTVILTLRKIMAAAGRSLFATNGAQALVIAAQEKPDLILLDIELPDMDGLEVCRVLKADSETSDIPILVITSHTEPGFEEKVFAAGAADYIAKPLVPAVVMARVNIHLRYHHALTQLSEQAHRDGLTGLYNRRSFDERLSHEWRRSQRQLQPLSLLMIDIDEFKKYNDALGHSQGDICLKSVAQALQDGLRRPADFVARYGGEEFVMVLPDTSAEGAAVIAEQLLKTVGGLGLVHAPDASRANITVSIGHATFEPRMEDQECLGASDLFKAADSALFRAKSSGRNTFVAGTVNQTCQVQPAAPLSMAAPAS